MTHKYCHQCGSVLVQAAKFCSDCGTKLEGGGTVPSGSGASVTKAVSSSSKPLTTKGLLLLIVATLAVWGVGWNIQSSLAGSKPTTSYDDMLAKSEEQTNSPELQGLRAALKQNPQDAAVQKELAQSLFDQIRRSEKPSPKLVLETIDLLRQILGTSPNDPFALLAMADLSFNQQVFDKAANFFEKYLAIQPDDHDARARYASALSFNGKGEQAEKELKQVLAHDPKHFHAMAYLAISYAQQGERAKALETGEKALLLAPDEEAKARFQGFLEAVKTARGQDFEKPKAKVEPKDTPLTALEAFIQSNQVAGPKFDSVKLNDKTVQIFFNQFPMEAMPPFVREKFVGSVKAKVAELFGASATHVEFLDKASGKAMVSEAVQTGSPKPGA